RAVARAQPLRHDALAAELAGMAGDSLNRIRGLLRRVGNHGSSAFGVCLRARIGPRLPALVAFAATARDHAGEIIAAVIVGDLGTYSDVLDGAYDDLVAYRMGLGIGPARVVCVASEVLSARSINRPMAIDLVKITVASGLKFIGLLVR